ncbi:MAG: hypothetical protein PWR07_399 [Bacillota bacterium]|nr:hypothetical protein [Bacillota bacterium]
MRRDRSPVAPNITKMHGVSPFESTDAAVPSWNSLCRRPRSLLVPCSMLLRAAGSYDADLSPAARASAVGPVARVATRPARANAPRPQVAYISIKATLIQALWPRSSRPAGTLCLNRDPAQETLRPLPAGVSHRLFVGSRRRSALRGCRLGRMPPELPTQRGHDLASKAVLLLRPVSHKK